MKFTVDRDRDIRVMMDLFLADTPDANARAKEAGVPEDVLKAAREASLREEALKILEELAKSRYEEDSAILETAVRSYQAAWDKIDHSFFSEVEKITGHAWQFPDYVVVVSLFHHGVSNSNENVVLR